MAEKKTYLPGLKLASKALRAFIVRYQEKLRQNMGEDGYVLLVALLDAVDAVIAFLETLIPPPNP